MCVMRRAARWQRSSGARTAVAVAVERIEQAPRRGQDRRERVAQIVRDDGEHVVAHAHGRARFVVQVRVVDGERDAVAELLRQRQIVLAVAARERHQRDGADGAVARRQRHDQAGAPAARATTGARWPDRARRRRAGVRRREDERLAGAHHARHQRVAGRRRTRGSSRARPRLGSRPGAAATRRSCCSPFDEIDDAVVAELRQHQPRDRRQAARPSTAAARAAPRWRGRGTPAVAAPPPLRPAPRSARSRRARCW